jgi:hypothetical protein
VNQKANLAGLGMLATDVPTLVDNLSFPFSNSHFLYTNIPAISYHASTIGANTILPPVWNYMLTSSLTTGLRDLRANDEIIRIYPNPAQTELKIGLSQNDINELSVRNLLGQDLINLKNKNSIDMSSLPNGIYILTVKQGENIYSKKFIKEH